LPCAIELSAGITRSNDAAAAAAEAFVGAGGALVGGFAGAFGSAAFAGAGPEALAGGALTAAGALDAAG